MEYKIIITTSGIGSRLGNITKFTNKSLIPIGNKYAISHILDQYDKNNEIIITLGYYGDHVREFLELAYPKRKFTFVYIDNYDGPGSSLGYSLLQAKQYLQCPFIFHACDCLIFDKPQKPNYNWIAGYKKGESTQYSTFSVVGDNVLNIYEKGEDVWDYIYIGLSGINDYKKFWEILEYRVNNNFKELSDIHVMKDMLKRNIKFTYKNFDKWYDIGNMGSLTYARKSIKSEYHVLEKLEESICFLDNFVIKFFSNPEIVKNRVTRGNNLYPLTPKILDSKKYFYKYEFSKGSLLSEYNDMNKITKLLNWCQKNLWIKQETQNFKEKCLNFYIKKTKKRINLFFKEHNINDTTNIINGINIDTIENVLNNIDIQWLCNTESYQFHGDFILDNIIVNNNEYKLLDWRQDFGGDLKQGDIYYDLAKLKHNLYINHGNIIQNLFKINIENKNITMELQCKFNLISQIKQLDNFIINNGYDLKKVNLLTSLIWLNISPLHHYPFSLFLFYFGKLNLYNILNNNPYI